MEDRSSGPREPRARPRERDPDRRPRSDRDRPLERPRDRRGDGRRERTGDQRGGGGRRGDKDPRPDRHGDTGRDPRPDTLGDRGHRAGELRSWEKSRQSRARDEAWAPAWDAAPLPQGATWETPEPPAYRKEGFGRRGLESDPTSERYVPTYLEPAQQEEYYQSEAEGLLECHKCKYLCTGRGVVQIVEVILNGMVLMCIVASYFVLAGFSASFASGGGFGNNYYSPFEGTELEQVRQLDQRFSVLRSPLIYGGVAASLGLGVLTLGALLQGARSLSRLPSRWLLLEATFSLLAAAAYCVGIGVYLHAALRINATDTCKTRERLYARKGLTWMNCQLSGTDGAAATFACLLVIMYVTSVVLALRAYREQKRYKGSQEQHRPYSDAPQHLWRGTL